VGPEVVIVWLASYPKSGNTWVRAFLANYSANARQPVDINTLPDFAFGDMRSEYFARAAGKPAETLTDDEIAQLRPQVHRDLARNDEELVFVKTHTVLAVIRNVPAITPETTAGAIYVVRNPLDVAPSFAHHYGLTVQQGVQALCFSGLEIEPKAGHVRQTVSDWSSHVQSWLKAPGLTPLVLRYEDLVAAPRKGFGALIEFLRWPKERERLERAIRQSSFRVLAEQERLYGFIERSKNADRFFRRGKVGGYRDELTAEQIDMLIDRHRETMRELGYLGADGTPRF